MSTKFKTAKSLLSPPGDTLLEHIGFIGMSRGELALKAGKQETLINGLIEGSEPFTRATASLMEQILGIPASLWMNMEQTYRTELQELRHLYGQNALNAKRRAAYRRVKRRMGR